MSIAFPFHSSTRICFHHELRRMCACIFTLCVGLALCFSLSCGQILVERLESQRPHSCWELTPDGNSPLFPHSFPWGHSADTSNLLDIYVQPTTTCWLFIKLNGKLLLLLFRSCGIKYLLLMFREFTEFTVARTDISLALKVMLTVLRLSDTLSAPRSPVHNSVTAKAKLSVNKITQQWVCGFLANFLG